MHLLRLLFVLAGILGAASGLPAQANVPQVRHEMAGSVTHDRAIVLVQLSGPGAIRLIHGTVPDPTRCLTTPVVQSTSATGYAVKFQLTGLPSGSRHWFATVRLDPDTGHELVGAFGSFQTAPAPSVAAPISFTVSADIRDRESYDLFDRMAAHTPDFFLSLGDFPYADGATTLAQYREFYRVVRADRRFVDFARHVAFLPVWDDHEVRNDWDATASAAEVTSGTAVWQQSFPVPDGAQEIYGAWRYGSAVELFVLDTRSHRDANATVDSPAKTMLGQTQRDWLQSALLASTATFKIVCTSVPLRHGRAGKDNWNGFVHERRDLLQWIAESGVENVVFFAGDHHLASAQSLREGMREYWFGPLAQTVSLAGSRLEPDVRWRGYELNYGLVRVDPTRTPATMTVEFHGKHGLLHAETFEAQGAPVRIVVTSDITESGFVVQGETTRLASGGREVILPRVEAGAHRFDFRPRTRVDGIPASISLGSLPGTVIEVATRWRDAEPTANAVLLAADFEDAKPQFEIVDEGTRDAPSSWIVEGGVLRQLSDIGDGNPAPGAPEKRGTMAIIGRPEWADYTLQARLRPDDDDAIGVVFRYLSQGDYYRFSFDPDRSYRRLVVCRGGVVTVLAEDSVPTDAERWVDVRASVVGDRIRVSLDGRIVFDVRDASHPTGRVGFYTWANMHASFDDLVVRRGDTTEHVVERLLHETFDAGSATQWTIVDQGTTSAPSRWAPWAGHFVQFTGISDGRPRSELAKLGTLAVTGDPQWSDIVLRTRVLSLDDDSIGLVFRYRSPNDHYRFQWDTKASHRRLVKVTNGTWTLLHEDRFKQYPYRWCDVVVTMRGSHLHVAVDGQTFCDLVDPDHADGRIGLYAWSNEGALFDDVIVERAPPERAVLAASQSGRSCALIGRSPRGTGLPYILMLSLGDSPGIPLSSVNPTDVRTLALNPDPLFFASLRAGLPLFAGIVGTGGIFVAPVGLPPIPGLTGRTIYAGGLVFEANARTVLEVVPTVRFKFP